MNHRHGFQIPIMISYTQPGPTEVQFAADMSGCSCYTAAQREVMAQAVKEHGAALADAIAKAAGLVRNGPVRLLHDSGDVAPGPNREQRRAAAKADRRGGRA